MPISRPTLREAESPKYATGDILEIHTLEYPGCGFNGYRAKVVGRADDMILASNRIAQAAHV
jgi:phenylacetate-coenzyme A ligase PaaK-like adenylate-forming protein